MPQLRVRAATSPWHVTTRSDEPSTRAGALGMWSLHAAPKATRASMARRTMADAGFRVIEDKLILARKARAAAHRRSGVGHCAGRGDLSGIVVGHGAGRGLQG